LIKKAETTIFKDEPSDETVLQAIQSLDKAASKGILHKNNVARRKSRLMKKFNLMQQQ
jgi:small subunit ribosomal protein S20